MDRAWSTPEGLRQMQEIWTGDWQADLNIPLQSQPKTVRLERGAIQCGR